MRIISAIAGFVRRLGQPDIMVWTLPLLMALLIVGTVAQRPLGLYESQHRFFSTFIAWIGPVPLPGGYTLIAVLALGLLSRFVFSSHWSLHKSGIILAHLGALLLLFGGLMTAITAREGYIVIAEGGQNAVVEDYHDRVLTVTRNDDIIAVIPASRLKPGSDLEISDLPFRISVESYCRNCAPSPFNGENRPPRRGPAAKIVMNEAPLEKSDEANHGAVTLRITGASAEQDGIYLLTEIMPITPVIEGTVNAYGLRFAHAETKLPFSFHLEDVIRHVHPGTDTPRAFESKLTVNDNGVTWPVEISMNHPLRYKGYTFYQSSYIRDDAGEKTVLSAVWNAGRLFPYISTLIIAVGLILHIALNVRGRRQQT